MARTATTLTTRQQLTRLLELPAPIASMGAQALKRALPLTTGVAALYTLLGDLALAVVYQSNTALLTLQIFGHCALMALAMRWYRNPLPNANLAALGVYCYFATNFGVSLWVLGAEQSLVSLALLNAGAFYFVFDRKWLAIVQTYGFLWILLGCYSIAAESFWAIALMISATSWVAGFILHVNRVQLFKQLYKARRALRSELISRQQAEDLVALEQRRSNLGAMVGGVAHDFRNLLTGIVGGLDIAISETQKKTESQTQTEGQPWNALQSAMQSTQAANDLCVSLLEYSKGEPVNFEPLDLVEILQEAIGHAQISVPSNVSIETHFEAQSHQHPGDRSKLRLAMLNLISNAAEVADSCVKISTQQVLHEGNRWISIQFEDDGPGIPSEARARIFDPFFTTKPTGQGLGLAAVASTVNAHNGQIEVKANDNGGTTFDIQLPCSEQQLLQNTANRQEPPRVAYATPPASLGSVLSEVFDQLPYLVFYKNTQNQHLRVNRAVVELFGIRKEELENTSANLWYPDEADSYYRDDREVIDTGMPKLNIEELIAVNPQTKHWFRTDKHPTFAPDGSVDGILVFSKLIEGREPVLSAPDTSKRV